MSEASGTKRRGLGMGLSALLGGDFDDAEPEAAGQTQRVPIAFLSPSLLQPRRHFDEAELKALADSIRAKGVLQPLVVRPKEGAAGYEIIAGERRWRAAQLAELHDLPVVVHKLSDRDVLEVALIENLQRADLSPIEEAEAYQRLIDDYGHTQEVVSTIIGKSRSHIANTLRLLKLPADVRNMVLDGRLSAGHARALLGAEDASGLARAIVERGLSVREVESLVAAGRMVAPKARASRRERDPNIVAFEQRLVEQLGSRWTSSLRAMAVPCSSTTAARNSWIFY